MIPSDLLNQLREKDPDLWEKIAETALSEYEYHDEEFNEWISNAITYTDLFEPTQEAWLLHCLMQAIRARGWSYRLIWASSVDICTAFICTGPGIHESVNCDTEAEALCLAYLEAIEAVKG